MTFRASAGILFLTAIGLAQEPHPKLEAIYRNPAARAASEDLTRKRVRAIVAQQELDKLLVRQKNAPVPNEPEVVAARARADAATTEAKAAASTVLAEPDSQLAPEAQWRLVRDDANQLKLRADVDAKSAIRLNLGLTLLGSLLALGAAVSGALKKPVVASVLSLCAGAVSGTPKLLGFDEKVEFYQQLYSGANSLESDIRFDLAVTVSDYNGYVKRLAVLNAHSGPGAAQTREAALALMNELLAAKAPHKD